MEKLSNVKSRAVPIPIENIDTDQIIPARFLKAVTKSGFGKNLFRDWRYDRADQPVANFVLNNNIYEGKILVAGKNFGCGSSREHAAWALYDYGFRVIISSFFADIFKSNALNNGMLPIVVSDAQLDIIFKKVKENPSLVVEVDVDSQRLEVDDLSIHFEIDEYKKTCLLNGFDDLDYLVDSLEDIKAFEKKQILF